MPKTKPEFVTEEQLEYLDSLRESGKTNMFGAVPYIQDNFPDLDKNQARKLLTYWMETFTERQSN